MATRITSKNTFKVKDQIRKLGGRWDGTAWVVPDDKADEAWALVGGKSVEQVSRVERTYRYAGKDCKITVWQSKSGDWLLDLIDPTYNRGSEFGQLFALDSEAANETRKLISEWATDGEGRERLLDVLRSPGCQIRGI